MSKIIFKRWKNIINMYFDTKNYLKSTHNYTTQNTLLLVWDGKRQVISPILYISIEGKKKKEGNTNRSDFPCNAQYTSHRNLHRN
jgi:hypothetical protein